MELLALQTKTHIISVHFCFFFIFFSVYLFFLNFSIHQTVTIIGNMKKHFLKHEKYRPYLYSTLLKKRIQ